jgi:hypothetical protein
VFTYSVYGGVLAADIEFPELSTIPETSPDWTMRIDRGEPPVRGLRPEGVHAVEPGWTMRLYDAGKHGRRLTYGRAGTFDIEPRQGAPGSVITWYPEEDLPEWFIRTLCLNTLLGIALHDAGILCLHGSAVEIDGKCIAFIAPKFHGKSTLAISLVARGARLITDDLVALEMDRRPPLVRPGVPSVRLLQDAADRLSGEIPGTARPGPKVVIGGLPTHLVASDRIPLETIYVLEPDADRGFDVERERLSLPDAAAQVALRTTLRDTLVGSRTAAVKLKSIARLVSMVGVYRLRTSRGFDRLEAITERVLAWHGAEGRTGVPA